MRRSILLGFIASLSLSLFAGAAKSAEEVRFNVCHTIGGGMYDETITRFADELTKRSNGRIQANVIAAGTMGTARESAEALQLGTLEMTWLADGEADTVVGGMGWAWLPYMFKTIEDAEQKYCNGWVREKLKEQMAARGIVSLCAAGNMYRNLVNTGREITSLKDFSGMKVRVPEQRDLIEFYTLCGALPVAIASSEALTALEQRTIDGADSAVINLYTQGFMERVKYITMLDYQYMSHGFCASKQWWDTLSAEDQKIIGEAAEAVAVWFRAENVRIEKTILEECAAKGITITRPDAAFAAELKGVAMQMWENARSVYAPEIIDRIFADFGE